MKKIFPLLLVLGAVIMTGCSTVAPNAGEEIVIIHKPYFFGKEGVDPTPISTGRSYVWWTDDSVVINMLPTQQNIHFEDLMSSDGVPLDFDSVIRLKVVDSVKLISKFGIEWYANNVQVEFMSSVRQAVRKHGMNETAISTLAIDEIDAEVSKAMEEYIIAADLPIKLIAVTIGKANPPDAIKTQRVDTAAQQQRIQTEIQRKLAEDQRKLAEESRAAADNAYRVDMKLSPDQYLELEGIKAMKEVCTKSACTFISGGGAVPTISVR